MQSDKVRWDKKGTRGENAEKTLEKDGRGEEGGGSGGGGSCSRVPVP